MSASPPEALGIEGITDAVAVGQGRFATVYRARQQALGRTVAVKVFRTPVFDEAARRRFAQECRTVAAMAGHPYIAAVHDWGHTSAGEPYQVMEYLPGGTLAARVGEFGALAWEEVADTGVKLAGALAAAHASGVRHGDIKPENVLLSSFDEPKLADFQGAQAPSGSLVHAAPEVVSGQPMTEVADVYSLASTLYALAAGHAPFEGAADDGQPLRARILSDAPPDLRASGVPDPVWGALAAALAKDPSARTSSARAFGEALRAAQRAAGVEPTRLVDRVPVPGVDPPAVPPLIETRVVTAPPPPVPPPPLVRPVPDRGGPEIRPGWVVALVVALLVLLSGAALALTTLDGGDDDTAQPATSAVPLGTSTLPPTTIPLLTTTTQTTAAGPTTTRPPAPTTTARTGTTASTAPPTPTTAGGIPPCEPSFFRATVTSDRSSYRNGETVQVVARFENTSGRPCSYTSTGATSQILRPTGEPLTPVRTLPGTNDDNVAFAPGSAQTFSSFWNASICNPPGTCSPGRYTMVVDVVPFGGGQVSFDVSGP